MKGEGSIELKSWFISRNFTLMVCECSPCVVAVRGNEKGIIPAVLVAAIDCIGA